MYMYNPTILLWQRVTRLYTFYSTVRNMVCLSISGPPSAPLNLTVSNVTNISVVLSWLPPEDDGGRDISEIYYTVIAEGGQ